MPTRSSGSSRRVAGYERDRELFEPDTGVTFDPLAAAESWVNTALHLLFHPERMSRLLEQSARGKADLSVSEVVDAVLKLRLSIAGRVPTARNSAG
jgi:hypothetical protein